MVQFKYIAVFLIAALSTNTITCFKKGKPKGNASSQYVRGQVNTIRDTIIANPKNISIYHMADDMACFIEESFDMPTLTSPIEEVTHPAELESINTLCGQLTDTYEANPNNRDSVAIARRIRETIAKQMRPNDDEGYLYLQKQITAIKDKIKANPKDLAILREAHDMACFYEETFDMEKLPMSTVNAVTHKVDSTKIDKLCKELTTIYDKSPNSKDLAIKARAIEKEIAKQMTKPTKQK